MKSLYLNNAATSFPKFEGSCDFIKDLILNKPLTSNRSYSENDIVETTRDLIAKTFNVEKKERMIFTSGATEGANLLLNPVDIKNTHVISTTTEHNCVLRSLNSLNNVDVDYITCDKNGFIDIDSIKGKIRQNTSHLIINHASNVTGAIQDIKKISDICTEKNIHMIVDASQSAGSIELNISEYKNTSFIFTGHKSLLGLTGTGFVYLSEDISPTPLRRGGNGIWSDLANMPKQLPYRYEAGTQNITGIASINYSLSKIKKIGFDNIIKKKKENTLKILNVLKDIPGVILYSPEDVEKNIGIVSFAHSHLPSDEFSQMLYDGFNIIVRSGLHCAPMIHKTLGTFEEGLVRISPSIFTTDEEIDIFENALTKIINAL